MRCQAYLKVLLLIAALPMVMAIGGGTGNDGGTGNAGGNDGDHDEGGKEG
jgi:hypothetical protein